MNFRPLSLPLLCGLCLGACAQMEPRAAPVNGAWNGHPAASEAHGADGAEVLAYFQRIKGLSVDGLTVEHAVAAQALAKRRSDVNRLKLALLLIQPRTPFKDEGRAAALASEVANNKAADAPEMKNLALLLAAIANEQRQQEERLQQLAQKQKDEEKRADALQQKLDALKSIEKDLIQREQTKTLKVK